MKYTGYRKIMTKLITTTMVKTLTYSVGDKMDVTVHTLMQMIKKFNWSNKNHNLYYTSSFFYSKH